MKSNTEIKLKQNLLATRKPQKDMSRLNEAMIGNCNMEVPEGKIDTKGAVPEVYADAINQRRNREKKIADDFKEQDKAIEDFTKESQKTENKPEGTPEMKKLHLSESLFDESFVVDTKLYKQAEDIASYLEEFMNSGITSNEDYFDDEDREVLSKTLDTLYDFAQAYSTVMDNEDVFEAVETPEKKKRTRGANEERWGIDYSDTDLWLQIYDELDASLENEGEGQQVNRFLKSRKGDRYQYIYPHGDNDIIVGAQKPEDFAYAKKVADYYGVTYDEPQQDKNARTNDYYKWTMVIHIPKDAEPKVKD